MEEKTLEYNSTREKLIIPEYGRNIQKMVEYALNLEDKNERTRLAYLIVNVMAQLNPQTRETGDHMHKLWDHLHIIADYKLDVDSPYPVPLPKDKLPTPEKPSQNTDHRIRYRYYGLHIHNLIKKAMEYEDGEEKDALVNTIANHLKKSYISWNRESIQNETINEHLKELSLDKLEVKESMQLESTSEILARNRKAKQAAEKKAPPPKRKGRKPRR